MFESAKRRDESLDAANTSVRATFAPKPLRWDSSATAELALRRRNRIDSGPQIRRAEFFVTALLQIQEQLHAISNVMAQQQPDEP